MSEPPFRQTVPALTDPDARRTMQLDTLAAILPMDLRDTLAQILTDGDIATLKLLAREGMGENTLRALEFCCLLASGGTLPWPAPEAVAPKIVTHHLWDPSQRAVASHCMPADVTMDLVAAGLLRTDGPHAPATVKRRLAHWSTPHRWKGILGPFAAKSLRADISKGAIFRAIDRWEGISDTALTPQAVNLILKHRCALAGLDPAEFSAHGLRSGYLTRPPAPACPVRSHAAVATSLPSAGGQLLQ